MSQPSVQNHVPRKRKIHSIEPHSAVAICRCSRERKFRPSIPSTVCEVTWGKLMYDIASDAFLHSARWGLMLFTADNFSVDHAGSNGFRSGFIRVGDRVNTENWRLMATDVVRRGEMKERGRERQKEYLSRSYGAQRAVMRRKYGYNMNTRTWSPQEEINR